MRNRGQILATLGLLTGAHLDLDDRGRAASMRWGRLGQGSMTRAGAQEGNRPESVTLTVTSFPVEIRFNLS